MKSILLYVSDDGSMEARLQAALDLTRAFDAHLTCLQALPIEVRVLSCAAIAVKRRLANGVRAFDIRARELGLVAI